MKDLWKMFGVGIACFLAAAPLFAEEAEGESNSCKRYGCGYESEEQLRDDIDLARPEGFMPAAEEEEGEMFDGNEETDPLDQDEMIETAEEGEEMGDDAAEMMSEDMDRAVEDDQSFRDEEMDPWEREPVMDKEIKLNHIEE